MESLIGKVKELSASTERAVADRDELMGMISETKATPEQYGQALDYLRLVNSGTPENLRKALKVMQEETAALARMLGEPVQGVDLLSDHADLKAEVEAGNISQAHAEELAAAREQRKLATQHSEQTSKRETEEQARLTAIESGKAALNQLEATLKTDPQYAAKRAILLPALKPVFAKLHPSAWAEAFKQAYDSVVVPAPAPNTGNGGTQQPLRGKQPAGQAVKQPSSMEEALSAGLARVRR